MAKVRHMISLTAGQAGEILAPVIEVVLGMDQARAQYWIGHKKRLASAIKKILIGENTNADLLADWEQFYRDLGIECDFSNVVVPDDPGGFSRVIIMAQGITPQSAYDLCAKNFPCRKWTDKNLDEIVTSDRTTKIGPYAIRIRDRIEADEELKNLSAYDLKKQGVPGITIEEREIFELKFFKETGKHLDIQNVTLYSGSRFNDGHVSHASWHGDEFRVDWCSPGLAHGHLRSRQAVSS